jgi:hypothetical protein
MPAPTWIAALAFAVLAGACSEGGTSPDAGAPDASSGPPAPPIVVDAGVRPTRPDGGTTACTTTPVTKTTGPISGTQTVCCDGTDMLMGVVDCGNGENHAAVAEGNCGRAIEGDDNFGNACAQITCQPVCP